MDDTRDTRNARQSADWRSLAERASKEKDPEKLMSFVSELSRLLEEQEGRLFRAD
jgi:hypothetical protein